MSHAQWRRRGQEGFTLIELLVVVLIIGILAAIAIPAFLGQKKKAQDMAAKSIIRSGVIATESYYTEEQTFAGMVPDLLAGHEQNVNWLPEVGLPMPAPATGTAPEALTIKNQVNVVLFGVDGYALVSKSNTGTYFSYIRLPSGASFRCSGSGAPVSTTVPTGCQGSFSSGW